MTVLLISLALIGLSAACYILWTFIHEFSHALAGKVFLHAFDFKFYWIPEKHDDGWTVASVSMSYPAEYESNWRLALMSAAPAIMDVIAMILFAVLATKSTNIPIAALNLLLFGGFIDILSNAFAKKGDSDFKKLAEYTDVRLGVWQLSVVLLSIALFLPGVIRMFL